MQKETEDQTAAPKKSLMESLSNPLSLAVVGAFLTLLTTIVTGYLSQQAAREASRRELQSELIKRFVEVPKTETIRANLRFLIGAGLLPDYGANIEAWLDANPNAAPRLTTGIVGTDERTPLATLDLSKQADFRGIGLLRVIGPGVQTLCSGFLVAPDVLLTGQCGAELSPDNSQAKYVIGYFELFGAGGSENTRLELDTSRMATVRSGDWSVALIGLKSTGKAYDYIPLSAAGPVKGTQFAMAFFATDKKNFMFSSGPDCKILSVKDTELRHLCDTGTGSGGAPLVTEAGTAIGIHMGNAEGSKRAMRADVIRKNPTVVKIFHKLPES